MKAQSHTGFCPQGSEHPEGPLQIRRTSLTYEIYETCEFDEIHRALSVLPVLHYQLHTKPPALAKKMLITRMQGNSSIFYAQMTCKIELVIDRESGSVFRVSGDLQGDSVRILEELLAKVSKHVVLDLKEVILADRRAVALLALFEGTGGELMNCPAYLREWVANERANVRSGRK